MRKIITDCHQFSGAMGLTLEFPLHLWTYRLKFLQGELGGKPAMAQRVANHVWPGSGSARAPLDEIPAVGDWTEYKILDKSIVVVRAKSGVKAFHNACRHRGVRLAKDHGNCRTQGFICPFHGWRWNMEGENTFVYGKHMFGEGQLDAEDLKLPEVRSEIWGGCVFINFDNDAPSYRATIGPTADRFDAHNVEDLKAEWWYGTVLPANWKIAMEAFMEGYHVLRTHPQLHAACATMYNSMYGQETGGLGNPVNPNMTTRENVASHILHLEELSVGMAGMVHAKEVEIAKSLADIDLSEDPDEGLVTWYGAFQAEITRQLRERGEAVPDLNTVKVSHYVHPIEFLFPNYFLLPMFSSMSAYRIRPLREIVVLRVAHYYKSPYEWGQHLLIGRSVGLGSEHFHAVTISELGAPWNERERLALKATDALLAKHDIDDELWARLAHAFDRKELMEILFLVGSYTLLAWVLNTVRMPEEHTGG